MHRLAEIQERLQLELERLAQQVPRQRVLRVQELEQK
jgi:hypothetical protein